MFSLGMAAPNLRAIGEGIAAGTLIFSIIERKPKLNYERYDSSIDVSNLQGDIEFRNVKFSYPSRKEQMVLKGVSLNF